MPVMKYGAVPQGDMLLGTGIAFTALGGLATIGRFVSKAVTKVGFGADDWCVLTGYIFWLVEQGLGLTALNDGIHAKTTEDQNFINYMKYTHISAPFYYLAGTFVRFGLLFFYRRVFAVPAFLNVSLGVMIFNGLFGLATFLAMALECIPMEYDWNPTVGGYCFPFTNFWISTMSIEFGIDVVILALPLWRISTLQMNLRRKIMVSGVFILGGFALFTGLFRIIITSAGQTELQVVPDILWMQVHIGTVFLCASLPTYAPLFVTFADSLSSLWSRKFSSYGGRSSGHGSGATPSGGSAPQSQRPQKSPYAARSFETSESFKMGKTTFISRSSAEGLRSDGTRSSEEV